MMTTKEILDHLRKHGSQKNVKGMQRFGIHAKNAIGVSAPVIRSLAKRIGKNHSVALKLWETEIHEARILSALIADPDQFTLRLLDRWAVEIQNWAQCDTCCMELFEKTSYAYQLPFRWSIRQSEFVRRAGIVMIAVLAVHHKKTKDEEFEKFFPLLSATSTDERNFVKKAVNWSLRQIGKRNLRLNQKAIALAQEIRNIHSPSAKWIAADALRELTKPSTIAMIQRRKGTA